MIYATYSCESLFKMIELHKPIDLYNMKHIKGLIGIYKITNQKGRIYIGQSVNIYKRFINYKNLSCKQQVKLFFSLKKYGLDRHIFEVIHLCEKEELDYLESYYGTYFNVTDNKFGLNIRECGGFNSKFGKETKEKLKKIQNKKFNYLSYTACKKWIKNNELTRDVKSHREWQKIKDKLPSFIPKAPSSHYSTQKRKKWKGWAYFLDNGRFFDFLPYIEAKEWVNKNLKLVNTQKKWREIASKLPSNIPNCPYSAYIGKGWVSWCEFLGNNNIRNRDTLTYEDAKEWVKNNELTKNIKSRTEWKKIINKLPSFIPIDPVTYYNRNGTFKSCADFFNSKNIANKYKIFYDS